MLGEAASGLDRKLYRVLVTRTPGEYDYVHWLLLYNCNTVENGIKCNKIKSITTPTGMRQFLPTNVLHG